MPIKIPNDLPAAATLQSENIFVMPETRAITQDIRPLEILILNLMPTKVVTETQFARLLGNTPLQVHLEFLHTRSHVATHVSAEHLFTFYKTFDEVRDRRYDGMIITGAPVEQLPFEDVEYWQELCSIMDWSRTHVHSTLHICWGAQAALYHHYGIKKVPLEKKLTKKQTVPSLHEIRCPAAAWQRNAEFCKLRGQPARSLTEVLHRAVSLRGAKRPWLSLWESCHRR